MQVADFSKMRHNKELSVEGKNYIIKEISKGNSSFQIDKNLKRDHRTMKETCQNGSHPRLKKISPNLGPFVNEISLTYEGNLSRTLIQQVHAYFRQLEHQLRRDKRDAGH